MIGWLIRWWSWSYTWAPWGRRFGYRDKALGVCIDCGKVNCLSDHKNCIPF